SMICLSPMTSLWHPAAPERCSGKSSNCGYAKGIARCGSKCSTTTCGCPESGWLARTTKGAGDSTWLTSSPSDGVRGRPTRARQFGSKCSSSPRRLASYRTERARLAEPVRSELSALSRPEDKYGDREAADGHGEYPGRNAHAQPTTTLGYKDCEDDGKEADQDQAVGHRTSPHPALIPPRPATTRQTRDDPRRPAATCHPGPPIRSIPPRTGYDVLLTAR